MLFAVLLSRAGHCFTFTSTTALSTFFFLHEITSWSFSSSLNSKSNLQGPALIIPMQNIFCRPCPCDPRIYLPTCASHRLFHVVSLLLFGVRDRSHDHQSSSKWDRMHERMITYLHIPTIIYLGSERPPTVLHQWRRTTTRGKMCWSGVKQCQQWTCKAFDDQSIEHIDCNQRNCNVDNAVTLPRCQCGIICCIYAHFAVCWGAKRGGAKEGALALARSGMSLFWNILEVLNPEVLFQSNQ